MPIKQQDVKNSFFSTYFVSLLKPPLPCLIFVLIIALHLGMSVNFDRYQKQNTKKKKTQIKQDFHSYFYGTFHGSRIFFCQKNSPIINFKR
jgi:hypothetical protein